MITTNKMLADALCERLTRTYRICKTCLNYDGIRCHRNAPHPGVIFYEFPVIDPENWCGEWENGNAFEEVNDGTKKS
jgi:hypothetical protein